MIRNNCVICNSNLQNFFVISNIPIKLSCSNENTNYLYEELSFSQCPKCNTIQLDKLIPLNILYSNSHNYTSVGKVWNEYFNLFCNFIDPLILNKKILEIGDPSGKIANRLNNYKKWYIIEPNKNNDITFNKNIEFINGFFDEKFQINDEIDLIIHSHLFEHIYEPNNFLKKCWNLLNKNGEMIFGVPNMNYIANSKISLFLGIFFEHNIFLNKTNIGFMLNNNGFEIINIIDYENHSTIYHVKKIETYKIQNIVSIDNYKNLFFDTIDEYKKIISEINNLNNEKEIYLFGASYNNQMLLSLGINVGKITGILDNSIDKQNKFFYGYNLKIYSPEILREKDCILVLKNGYYSNEIKHQILAINPNTFFVF